jgi:hypothetical protein
MRTILSKTTLFVGMICVASGARGEDLTSVSRTALEQQPPLTSDIGFKPRRNLPASWKWSLAPVLASQALDSTSSYGMRELNPILGGSDGRFGMQSVAIKLGVTGMLLGAEYLIVRAHPRAAQVFTKLNWAAAVVTFGVAAHNYAIK